MSVATLIILRRSLNAIKEILFNLLFKIRFNFLVFRIYNATNKSVMLQKKLCDI